MTLKLNAKGETLQLLKESIEYLEVHRVREFTNKAQEALP